MKLRNTPKEYQDYYHSTDRPMAWAKWQVLRNKEKQKQENFPSHNTPKKTVWDKIDNDLLYRAQLETRHRPDKDGDVLGIETMSNRKVLERFHSK
jgi:hypothetical protein